MTLAEHLASPAVQRDIPLMIATMANSISAGFTSILDGFRLVGLKRDSWIQIGYVKGRESEMLVSAYYWIDGQTAMVSDMAEGVRALRLRTRCDAMAGQIVAVKVIGAMHTEGRLHERWGPFLAVGNAIGPSEPVPVLSLADAVWRVMLISLRIAQWELQ